MTDLISSILLFLALFLMILGIYMIVASFTFLNEDVRDKKKIYDHLYKKAIKKGHHKLPMKAFGDDKWQTIEEIANGVNLTLERTQYICIIDERIRKLSSLEYEQVSMGKESWGLREFVGDD